MRPTIIAYVYMDQHDGRTVSAIACKTIHPDAPVPFPGPNEINVRTAMWPNDRCDMSRCLQSELKALMKRIKKQNAGNLQIHIDGNCLPAMTKLQVHMLAETGMWIHVELETGSKGTRNAGECRKKAVDAVRSIFGETATNPGLN